MKSLRKAFQRNSEYHQNLLGEEFDALVQEATEKTLLRPNPEANQKVIIAISDPNTGLELTPQKISQELRRILRSSNGQRQWLAACLVQEVLSECGQQLQSVLLEILETVGILATRSGTAEVNRRTREKAMEILNSHGSIGNQAFRNSSGLRSANVEPSEVQRTRTEPQRSMELIRHYDPIVRQHCDVMRGLIKERETRGSGLVEELMIEVKEMRRIVVRAVEAISFHSSDEVEAAVISAVNLLEVIDQLKQFSEEMKHAPPEPAEEPDLIDPRSLSSPSLGTSPKPVRRATSDLLGLDDVEVDIISPSQDPFQELANAHIDHPNNTQSNFNPFRDASF